MRRMWLALAVAGTLALWCAGVQATVITSTLVDKSGKPLPDGKYTAHLQLIHESGAEILSQDVVINQASGLYSLTLPDVSPYMGSYKSVVSVYGGNAATSQTALPATIQPLAGPHDNLYVLRAGDVINWNGSFSFKVVSSRQYPLQGQTSHTSARAVYGNASSTTGSTYGGNFSAAAPSGIGVYAQTTSPTGLAYGIWGVTYSNQGRAIYGQAKSLTGTCYGLYGRTDSNAGVGLFGLAGNATGPTVAIRGESKSDQGTAIYGWASSHTGTTYGVYGVADSPDGYGGVMQGAKGLFLGSQALAVTTSNDGTIRVNSGLKIVLDGGGDESTAFSIYQNGIADSSTEIFRVEEATGNVLAKGTFNANSLDLAENFATLDTITPGDVVVLDPSGGERLTRCSKTYDTSVAGIVSTQPGFLLGAGIGADTSSKVPLALAGRAPCKVDATHGAIMPGDLLTTSATLGYAMKADLAGVPRGSIIGKALEPLAGGTGTIKVLVMSR